MNINNLYTRNLATVEENESLSAADFLMNDKNIRHLPVMNKHNFLVGIISKTDIKALKNTEVSFTDLKVKSFMTKPAEILSKKSKIKHVAQFFIDKKISSAVIVENEEPVGIVTTEDILRLFIYADTQNKNVDTIDLEVLLN